PTMVKQWMDDLFLLFSSVTEPIFSMASSGFSWDPFAEDCSSSSAPPLWRKLIFFKKTPLRSVCAGVLSFMTVVCKNSKSFFTSRHQCGAADHPLGDLPILLPAAAAARLPDGGTALVHPR